MVAWMGPLNQLPIELLVVLAINLVVAVFAYYAIAMWDVLA
jgi:hypothetical protein